MSEALFAAWRQLKSILRICFRDGSEMIANRESAGLIDVATTQVAVTFNFIERLKKIYSS